MRDLSAAGQPAASSLVSFRRLSKTFGKNKALDAVTFDVDQGEIHALVGQNGSGKSTLIKILAGLYAADKGSQVTYAGEPLDLHVQSGARRPGLHVVHQDPGLIRELNAVENFGLTRAFDETPLGRVNWKIQSRHTEQVLATFGLDIDVRRPMGELSPLDRAVTAIAFAVQGFNSEDAMLVLDEPTAVLPHGEVERLLEIVRELRTRGVSVLYVSHRLDEVINLADRVTVLRDGLMVATRDVRNLSTRGLGELMVGSDLIEVRPSIPRNSMTRPWIVELDRVVGGPLNGVSLRVAGGEILGIAGLPGSGAEDVLSLLSGASVGVHTRGRVRYAKGGSGWLPISKMRGRRVPMVPADRLRRGVIKEFSVRENLTLAIVNTFGSLHLSRSAESAVYARWAAKLQVKASSPESPILTLSGGNQQKIVIGRAIATNPELLLLAEPTAGVDIGAREAIYELLQQLSRDGLSIVMISSDFGDLLALCHRILVLSKGRIVQQFHEGEADELSLLQALEEEPRVQHRAGPES